MQSEQVRMTALSETAVDIDDHKVGTKRGEVFVLAREALDIVTERREELEAVAKDALAHLNLSRRPVLTEDVRLLFNRVCGAFQLEPVRVYVEIMGDDVLATWTRDAESERMNHVYRFLHSFIWRPVNDQVSREFSRDVVEDPTPDTVWQVRLWPVEVETFQTAMYAKYLRHLVERSWFSHGSRVSGNDDVWRLARELIEIFEMETFWLEKTPIPSLFM